jgi:hypothetical protein
MNPNAEVKFSVGADATAERGIYSASGFDGEEARGIYSALRHLGFPSRSVASVKSVDAMSKFGTNAVIETSA